MIKFVLVRSPKWTVERKFEFFPSVAPIVIQEISKILIISHLCDIIESNLVFCNMFLEKDPGNEWIIKEISIMENKLKLNQVKKEKLTEKFNEDYGL